MSLVPDFLIPAQWLAQIAGLSRPWGIFALLISLVMLVAGARAFRWLLVFGLGAGAWFAGSRLGTLMHVTTTYVAAPAALMTMPLVYPIAIARRAMMVVAAVAAATVTGSFLAYTLHAMNYWGGWTIGLIVGGVMAVMALEFSRALFFAALGTAGVIASIGPVAQKPSGIFSAGAYAHDPMLFLLLSVFLILASMISQAYLAPEEEM